MAITDVFEGAKNVFTFYFAYLNAVGEEIGMERAIALDAGMGEVMGAAQGQAIKAQVGMDEIDLATAASLASRSIEEGMGISSEVTEESAERIVCATGRCPLYEAHQLLGADDATIEARCRATALPYMDAMVKQWNPQLSYKLKEFRSSPEGPCLEEIVLE